MTEKPDTVNIPAYLRKRSISAKARQMRAKRASISKRDKKSQANQLTAASRTKRQRLESFVHEIPIIEELDKTEIFPAPIESEPDNRSTREMKICGMCEGYFDKIEVAIVKLTSPLRRGDRIIFEKQDGLFEQKVDSMQINRKNVRLAKTGSDIGLKVTMQPKVGAPVYKII